MTPDEELLEDVALGELAGAVLDGTPVDWEAVESSAGEEKRELIRELRLLAEVSAVHHTLPSVAPLTPAEGETLPEYWGHLKIVERIGSGTFGEVFRAWDSRLDRDVALKLMRRPAECGVPPQGSEATSIIEEGRLLARVRHPNVITVYGAERTAGRTGIWMELIRGRTLEEIVREHGPLGVDEAIAVGIDVCRALSAVHDAGLLHGDIKAQNVMRESSGRIVVMDFGAGRAQLEDSARGDVAGTPLYLAPELLRSQEATRQSEIYSVGVLLFHIVTGSYPVAGRTLDAVRDAHLHGRRLRLADARPDLPDMFVRVVDRALETEAAQRYDSPNAIERALAALKPAVGIRRRQAFRTGMVMLVAVAAVGLAALVFDVGGSRRLLPGVGDRRVASATDEHPKRIAVLRFVGVGNGPDDETLADGLAEDLIARLNAFDSVRVISAGSSFSHGPEVSLVDMGARLNVDALLTGTVQRSGESLEVAARLVGLPDERELWHQKYSRPVAELFVMQAEITSDVAAVLRLGAIRSARQWPTQNVDAYALYVRGRAAWAGRTPGGARTALQLFEQAATLDPAFAQAHAGMAMAYHQLADVGQALSAEEAYPKVAAAAARALALGELTPEAHLAAAAVKVYERDLRGVEREHRRAIELDPNSAVAHEQYGMLLSLLGRFSEALEHVRLAQSLDPLSPRAAWSVATVLRYARRYDEALAEAGRALDLDPNYGAAYHTLGLCYTAKGRFNDAIDAYRRSNRPGGNLGHAYAVSGRRTEARLLLNDLEKRDPQRGNAGHIAQIYVGLGDLERAFEWLYRGAERMPANIPTWKVAEVWDPLRSDPRFAELLKRAGLAEPKTGGQ